jgi:hypothetical protein
MLQRIPIKLVYYFPSMSLPRCSFCRYDFHPRSCVRSQRLEGTKCPAKARLKTSLEWMGTVHRPNEHIKINTNSDLFGLMYVFWLYVERLLHNIQLGHMKRCTGHHFVPVGSHLLSAVIKLQSRTFRHLTHSRSWALLEKLPIVQLL